MDDGFGLLPLLAQAGRGRYELLKVDVMLLIVASEHRRPVNELVVFEQAARKRKMPSFQTKTTTPSLQTLRFLRTGPFESSLDGLFVFSLVSCWTLQAYEPISVLRACTRNAAYPVMLCPKRAKVGSHISKADSISVHCALDHDDRIRDAQLAYAPKYVQPVWHLSDSGLASSSTAGNRPLDPAPDFLFTMYLSVQRDLHSDPSP